MEKVRVYLSSTFIDLQKHRAKLIKFFTNIGERFELRNMETYVPNGQKAVDACLEDVSRCDIYILLIGRRYGWIPGENPADPDSIRGDDRISITNLELNKAIETGRKVFVFLCDPNDPALSRDADDSLYELKQEKLKGLRSKVSQYKHHAAYFTTEDNLAVQVAEAVILSLKAGLTPQEKSKLVTIFHTYCYDRLDQNNKFRENVVSSAPFKVFVIHGNEDELGESFIHRLGYFNLNLDMGKFQIPMNEILYNNTTYEKIRKNFLFKLSDLFSPGLAEREPNLSPQRLFSSLETTNLKRFAFYTKLTSYYWQNGYSVLNKLIAEFLEASNSLRSVAITWFVLLEDVPESKIQEDGPGIFFTSSAASVYVLPRLNPFPIDFIENWINDYITSIPGVKRKILRSYFLSTRNLQPQDTCQTEEVESELRKLVSKLHKADTELLELISI